MKKILKYKLLGLALILASMVSCDQAEQDASPVVEPNESYPMVTYTPMANTTIAENDTVVLFTITTDRPVDRALTFRASQTGGTANSDDYTIINATVQPYTTEAQMIMITTEGWQGEATETADFIVRMTSLADKYLINPDGPQSATISLSITNNVYPVTVHCDLEDGETTPDGKVSVYFDGDVTYVEGKTITFHDKSGYQADEIINSSENITFEDGEYVISHIDFWEWTTIEMTVEAGAFVDDLGNLNEEYTIEFSIPFYLESYTGTVQRTYFSWDATFVTDTVDVSILDEENFIVGIPDIGFAPMEEDELVGDIEVFIDVNSYKADVLDKRYNLYLNYYNDNDDYGGYYIEDATWFWDACIEESSQFLIRGVTGVGYFDDVNFSFGVVYSIITELVVGDGTYGTNDLWITTSSETGEHVSKNSLESYNKVYKQLKVVEKVERNGNVAYKVEFE
ncbi:MAG: hypothetical protein AB7S50_06480 [Bacteroidales bacterium]